MSNKYKAIVFDFDGVIVESVDVKRDAFEKLFLKYPEKVEEIVGYHMEHGGVSRFKKFDYIYENILKEELTPEKKEWLGDKFTEYSFQAVVDAPFVKGAKEFLEDNLDEYLFFVATGTPQDEIDKVVRKRDLEKYFKGIYGSPATKSEIVLLIMEKFNLDREDIIFVGDAITDYTEAGKVDVQFVGRVHEKYENPFKEKNCKWQIPHLEKLDAVIKSI